MRLLAPVSFAALAALTSCAVGDPADLSLDADDPSVDAGALDATASADAAIDAAIDAPPPPALRIRRVTWRWTGCTAAETADGFGLDVAVEVADAGVPVAIHGDLTGCESFDGSPGHSACAPSLPPTGRVLTVIARRPGAGAATASTPVVDCVAGQWDAPPDDDGDSD